MASALISKLDRSKIFPPSYCAQPEDFIVVDTQQRFCVKGNCFYFCCVNVKKAAKILGNKENMRTIFKATGIYWRNATNEEKDVYRNLHMNAKIICSRMNNAAIIQPVQPVQPVQSLVPNPIYETMSDQFNNGFSFNTESEIFFLNVW